MKPFELPNEQPKPRVGNSRLHRKPESIGAKDYKALGREVLAQEPKAPEVEEPKNQDEVEVKPAKGSNGSPAPKRQEDPPMNPVTIRTPKKEKPVSDELPELPAEAMAVAPPSSGGS